MEITKKSVDEWLNDVDYAGMSIGAGYTPSTFAINYVNFIKLVNGAEGEQNLTPVVHLKMLDGLGGKKKRLANLCSRGMAKTTIFAEYLVLYLAMFNKIEGFGQVNGMLYVADSMENGAKNLRKNVEHRYYQSDFMQKYVPKATFTDTMMEFENLDGRKFAVKLFGAKTGLRGSKIYGRRPELAVLDDLVHDKDANSPASLAAIKATIHSGVKPALDPTRFKIVFSGTPFNKNDPLYEVVESGAWHVNVYPVCEKFPCSEEEFVGAWPDRFTYEYVKDAYDSAVMEGTVSSFMQELMLRITSDEDRMVLDSDIQWYNWRRFMENRHAYNFYITTDFATSSKKSADYSVISVWAINHNGDWFWVDGICKKQNMADNENDLFRLVQMYEPMSVGIEVSGQQGGFVDLIRKEMQYRNIYFNIASDNNGNRDGIRPVGDKMERFNQILPWIKQKKFYFPEDLRDHEAVQEAVEELFLATYNGFKSKHDDFLDTMSMLSVMKAFRPSQTRSMVYDTETSVWAEDSYEEEDTGMGSYLV